jgi:valyl-tRNA synthetase
MMPPPNVTGSLHMGHALTFTIQDILIRYHRMQGKEVLWQAGTDHAGIATQMVVERQLREKKIDRKDIGRSKFIEKIWDWKKESGGIIANQLRRLGSSADWSRERFTMDEGLSQAVKKVFVELHDQGIIYKDKRLVNWDPKLLTAISDLEVEQKVEEGTLWYIKYPIDKTSDIIIATTRPETMLGDVAIAVHPDDKRYSNLINKYCYLPLSDKKIKIIADEYADPNKGSGAVKITPAHDFNDFEVGKKHNLDSINIFDKFAKCNHNVPERFRGLDRYVVRKKVLEELKNLNLLVKEEKQTMVIPYGDRSGVVIEPWLTDQWFCDAKKLSLDPINSVRSGETKFVPKVWEKTFFNWMENIQPWCISRQLWWGHQIPAWYGPDKKIFVAENIEGANKKASEYYSEDFNLVQDEDVLDTWFSSALWTFSTLDWPEDSYELKRFYPGNVLVTGFDIIFFWVARMMMMGSYFMKKTPFKHIYIHPLIRDERGQKMSKSKGNVINPLDLLDKFGADTLRFTLTALLNPGRDVKLAENRVKGYKSFTNKIWNASNFLKINQCIINDDFDYSKVELSINQWLINELSNTKNSVEKLMSLYLFHEVANEIYHFIWHIYCNWYVEFAKSLFEEESIKSKETKNTSIWVFREILKLVHPLMPFISEKLWKINFNKSNFLMNELNIVIQYQDNFKDSQNKFKKLIQIITSIRNLRSELDIPYKEKINLEIKNEDFDLIDFIKNYSIEIIKLLKIDNLSFNTSKIQSDSSSASIILSNTTLVIPLKGIIDTKKEIEKLLKKKVNELTQSKILENKLKNSSFMAKAPKKIVLQFEQQLSDIKSSIDKIDQIINTIK